MATFERHVEVNGEGTLMDGKGQAQAGTGAFTLPGEFPVARRGSRRRCQS